MKKITIRYISGLGDFLDEKNINWVNDGDETITIMIDSIENAFLLGYSFGIFYKEVIDTE